MKIKDILINEAPEVTPAAAPNSGSSYTGPVGNATNAPAAGGKVAPQPTLNGKPSTGPKGQAWLKKYGATHNPDGTPKAAAGNTQPAPGGPTTITNPAQANQAAAPAPAPAAEPAAAPAATTPPPQANPLGVQAQAGGALGQPTPQADVNRAPTEPAPAPAPVPATTHATTPAPAAAVNPDTGLSTAPAQVKTGTGGTTNLTTASQDEYAWRAKNPNWNMTGAQYPGSGKWDPTTGRTKRESIEYHQKDNQLLQRMREIAGLK